MRRLSGWDTYVQEALKKGDRSIELPLTDDETYVVPYPTRRQGREIARAQVAGDTDRLLVAMLGKEAGTRVKELAEDQPAYVLDEFLLDVMRKFGMIPEDDGDPTQDDDAAGDEKDAKPEKPAVSTSNGQARNGRAVKGKGPAARKSATSPKR